MDNLRPNSTGVEGGIIWTSAGEFFEPDKRYGPRIKVMQGTKFTLDILKDSVNVKLTDPPEILGILPRKLKKQVIKYVNINRNVLLRYWDFEISTCEMVKLLKRV